LKEAEGRCWCPPPLGQLTFDATLVGAVQPTPHPATLINAPSMLPSRVLKLKAFERTGGTTVGTPRYLV